MDAHMDEKERSGGNRRNGYTPKQVQTPLGEVTVHTPRDRESTFEPEFIRKRERILADGVADRIIGLYALGNSTREISDWMEENLGNRVSAETISSITDRVLPEIQSWRSRPLENVYAIVLDGCHSLQGNGRKESPCYTSYFIISSASAPMGIKICWVCISLKAREPIFGCLVSLIYKLVV